MDMNNNGLPDLVHGYDNNTSSYFGTPGNYYWKVYLSTGTVSAVELNYSSLILNVFPNPTSGKFSIELEDDYNSVTVTLTDLVGKTIQSKVYNDSQLLNLNIEEPLGIYLLVIETGDKKAVLRLVKE
jgi:hypothetical protein